MKDSLCCKQCREPIPAAHLRAGYVRPETDALCILCLSRARAGVWTVPEPTLDLRKAAWAMTGLSLGLVAMFLMQQEGLGNLGLGLFVLAASGSLLLYKVAEADLL